MLELSRFNCILFQRKFQHSIFPVSGEDRYTCFNYTVYKADMPQDQQVEVTGAPETDLDDFDPFNDLEDFPEHGSSDEQQSPDVNTMVLIFQIWLGELSFGTTRHHVTHSNR